MKKLVIFCLGGVLAVFQAVALKGNFNSNYVVIGAFSIPKNALEFTESANKANLHAQFSMNPTRKLFYVYVLATDDKTIAVEQAKKLRKETPYFDTWVYTGALGDLDVENGTDLNPVTGNLISKIESNDTKQITESTHEVSSSLLNTETEKVVDQKATATTIEEMADGARKFLFKITTSGKVLSGDVDVMDLDRSKARKSATYRGNELVKVKPINKSGNIGLQCEVFGYRKMNYNINFNDPKSTGILMEDGNVVVPYDLVRLKKGDFAVMYNVFFYKDAAIMRPESRYEVTSLQEMLNENPKYRIRIHGHTNGNGVGKIIRMGEGGGHFSLNNTKEGFGSAKALSEERAKIIFQYLVSKGIDPTRMEVKAWGGKKPIYDEDHPNAHANVRVEIEILAD